METPIVYPYGLLGILDHPKSHLDTLETLPVVFIHRLLTCSFAAQKPPLCSGRCSHCDRRLRTLFPLQWLHRLPHVGWSAQTRTPSGAFVGQSALQSSGVNCHQNHLRERRE